MKKNKLIFGLLSAMLASSIYAQDNPSYWQMTDKRALAQMTQLNSKARHGQAFNLDVEGIEQVLLERDSMLFSVPLPNGEFKLFQLQQSAVMAAELAERYPSIKTFTGYEIANPEHKGRFDITPQGFHGVFNYNGDKVFIDPVSRDSRQQYMSYYKSDAEPLSSISERRAPLKKSLISSLRARTEKKTWVNDNHITYRIAIATTGEYAQFHGGTKEKTLAALTTMLNRINEVYERDLAITLQLVANNDALIFTDAETDPFGNTDEDIDLITEAINRVLDPSEYDLGHIVGTGGGGIAGFAVACTEYKAEGLTGSDVPTNDAFYIDYVAHEIGHQLGADHTFNGTSEACEGNRAGSSAYEPGSASTIMGYAGICGEQNLQYNSDPYFHIHSIDQIKTFTQQGEGQQCGVRTAIGNQAPEVNAGSDFTIPANTPFELTGQASDSDSDNLSYSWQQFDLGNETSSPSQDKQDSGSGPLFRTFAPSDKAKRMFPQLSDVLAGSQSYGEVLPSTARELNFRFVVRDQQGNVGHDEIKLTVINNDQGFQVTTPSRGDVWQAGGQLVRWNTANTENAPVSCDKVDLALSSDSGNTFDVSLAQGIANTGEAEIQAPAMASEKARVKVSCSNNVFFALSPSDFTINIQDGNGPTKPVYTGQQGISMDEDSNKTLSSEVLSFNQAIDKLTLLPGDNYTVNGMVVSADNNFNGALSVNATASSGALTSEPFIIQVSVMAVNDAPSAVDDAITVEANSQNNVIDVLSNDSDIDSTQLSIKSVNYTGSGSVVIQNNQLLYSPAVDFSGVKTFSYVVSDDAGAESQGEVTVTINAPVEPEPEPKSSSGGSYSGTLAMLTLMVMLITRRRRAHA